MVGGLNRGEEKEKLLDLIVPAIWSNNDLTGSLALIITCYWYGNFCINKCIVQRFSDSFLLVLKKKKKKKMEEETACIAVQIMPCSSSSCKLRPWRALVSHCASHIIKWPFKGMSAASAALEVKWPMALWCWRKCWWEKSLWGSRQIYSLKRLQMRKEAFVFCCALWQHKDCWVIIAATLPCKCKDSAGRR